MAWRFKASKFKNATPIVPKPEACVRDITVGSYQTYGNNIAASAAFMAFNVDHNGSSLGVLPIDDCGRKSKTMPLLHAHTDTVTDMDFSNFHDGLLATGSQDCMRLQTVLHTTENHLEALKYFGNYLLRNLIPHESKEIYLTQEINIWDMYLKHHKEISQDLSNCKGVVFHHDNVKIWHIPEKGLEESLCNPEVTFSHRQRRVECVKWHPTADGLLTTASYSTLTLWDVIGEKEIYSMNGEHGLIQSVSWCSDGKAVAVHTKEKTLCIVDPRGDKVTQTTSSHQSIKDSRVVWLGDTTRVLTTGFDAARQREVYIRDLRNFNTPEKSLVLDSSTGILIPLYDADTCMLFLAGKGDTTISYLEVTDREPYLVEGIRHCGEQTKGACLVPKRALNVMQAEVNRVLQLTSSSVIPIMYQVPRKSYRDFHTELFPDTAGSESNIAPSQWMQGLDVAVSKISLDPANKQVNKQVHRGPLCNMRKEIEDNMARAAAKVDVTKPLEPLPKPYRNNIPTPRTVLEKENNETNEAKQNMRNSIELKRDEGAKIQNGSEAVTPPKPLPRMSRTGSLSETEDQTSAPKPRPRNNSVILNQLSSAPQTGFISSVNVSGGYKPRLGPKPFTPPKLSEASEALDRTCQMSNKDGVEPAITEVPPDIVSVGSMNGNEKESPEPVMESENLDVEEVAGNSGGSSPDEVEVEGGELERGGVRSSIAERRKMYERSQSVQEPLNSVSPAPLRRRDSLKALKVNNVKEEESSSNTKLPPPIKPSSALPPASASKRTSTVFGRVSKYRHLKGTPVHKSQHIENVRNVSRQISGECDGFHANKDRVAVPLGGPGGKIAVFELSKPGKLPDGVIPTLVNASNVMDFAWDPFNNSRLAAGCDDGIIKLWMVPDDGLSEPTNVPHAVLQAHSEKIYCIKFHPLARDILATTSYDMTTRIWDLSTLQQAYVLKSDDQMVAMAWSSCGTYLSTVSRGSIISIFDPRTSDAPIRQGKGPGGTRGARIVWGLDGAYIAVMGFDKVSERQIMVFWSDDLNSPLTTVGLDVSPAILIPFYDEDSSTLFLTGRGDSTIYAYEMSEEAPYLNPLSHHRCGSLHQGLSFLPKCSCDVSSVEFAKALRLTNTTIEPLSFTVPRIKSDLFQDDLFPETKITWEPTMSSTEWLEGCNRPQQRLSLKPPNMDSLSEAQGTPASVTSGPNMKDSKSGVNQQLGGRMPWMDNAVKQKQEQIQKSVSSRVEVNMKLEQDRMEGVDEIEWTE